MPRPVDLYVTVRARLLDLLEHLDPTLDVPATPGWDVQMVVAHLVGLTDDLVHGNVDEYAEEAWTAAQVAARAGRTVPVLVAEWDALLPEFLEVLGDPLDRGLEEFLGIAPLVDLAAHDLDLRHAAGVEVAVDPDLWSVIGPRRRFLLDLQLTDAGLPALRVCTPEGDDWTVGDGPPVGTVRAPRLDLWRSLEGRRRRDEVRAFAWTVDPEPYLPVWPASVFDWPTA